MKKYRWKKLYLLLLSGLCIMAVIYGRPEQESFLSVETIPVVNMERGDRIVMPEKEFYSEPLSNVRKEQITGVSYPAEASGEIQYEDLCCLHVLHYDFDHVVQRGELICNQLIAEELLEIFRELFEQEYPIERICLIEEYHGDDESSMEDNNTSCFNYRQIAGSSRLSSHSLGLAVDINPLYNPCVSRAGVIQPQAGYAYADRSVSFPYKIDHEDLCYQLFTEHGFVWGGDWTDPKDYQHFEYVK